MKTIDSTHYLIEVSIDNENLPEEYPFDLPVVKNLEKLTFNPKITFIVGENGAGKSTLLEALAVAMGFNAEGGSKNFNFKTKSTHSELHKRIKVTKGIKLPKDGYFLRAETFYNVATEVGNLAEFDAGLFSYYGGKSLHEQSHGESFISLIENRFKGNGLYILDEPEAALSPANQFKLLVLIHELLKKDSQFIIATHSPIILGYPDADIFMVGKDSIEKIKYEDTSHYQLTKYFLTNREKMLKELLGSVVRAIHEPKN